jgi:hypothetical protein
MTTSKTADLEREIRRALADLCPDLFAELVDARVPPLAIVGVELIDYTDGVACPYFPSAASGSSEATSKPRGFTPD